MRHVVKGIIGVLTDSTLSMTETGGPPAVEQALRALQTDALEDVEIRLATFASREVDLRPRRVSELSRDQRSGATSTTVDISRSVALVLLGLVALDLVVRVA